MAIYMSLTGNDNSDGTENNPVRSLSKAIDKSPTNGNIYIEDGDYPINTSTEYHIIRRPGYNYMLFYIKKTLISMQ